MSIMGFSALDIVLIGYFLGIGLKLGNKIVDMALQAIKNYKN